MNLKDTLYYLNQYRSYDKAGMVPEVHCRECDIAYMIRVNFDNNDEIVFYCYQCGHEMTPGYGITSRMIKYVKDIED